jgi:hypothetical protein
MKTNDVDKIKELIFRKVHNEIVQLENRKSAVKYRGDKPLMEFDNFSDEVSIGKLSIGKTASVFGAKSFATKSSTKRVPP